MAQYLVLAESPAWRCMVIWLGWYSRYADLSLNLRCSPSKNDKFQLDSKSTLVNASGNLPAAMHKGTIYCGGGSGCEVYGSQLSEARTRVIEPMLAWCWATVTDGGPASSQHGLCFIIETQVKHWITVSQVLRRMSLGTGNKMPRPVIERSLFACGPWHTHWRSIGPTSWEVTWSSGRARLSTALVSQRLTR